MEMIEDAKTKVSIPHGGPIYVPDLVGPLTKVLDFETSVLEQLEHLKAEICSESSQPFDEDFLVDELKVWTEEELVDRACKEAFQASKYLSLSKIVDSLSSQADDEKENFPNNKSWKKAKRKKNMGANNHDSSYMSKVEQLVKLKQKQDEDKAAARLHSFNGGCIVSEAAISTSEKNEKMTSLKCVSYGKVRAVNIRDAVPLRFPEVVLCVEIYDCRQTWVKNQEFLVLGCQMLTELRDQICCSTDLIMKKAGQYDPSAYFLIEDVFCNDLRDPTAIDYSEPIFDWIRKSKNEALAKWDCIMSGELQKKQKAILGNAVSGLPCFKATDMQKTRFCDLGFRIGAGYLYCHQGDCRHTIVIRDMRLIHSDDVKNRSNYPIRTFQRKSRPHKCCVCKIYRAAIVTLDDKWAQENPCYFCNDCFKLLHGPKDGSLLYNEFVAYEYIPD
ncbi:snRNA-activating protein complex, subunit 3 [Dillenia turbinata]|uniref:snRNA-activating protein complex, subunit 3 n=1 Tax=Dillenia turbinata TaxID=194707 RepID=A0AAN8VYY9_9MAGN